jgi:hypothetical protein
MWFERLVGFPESTMDDVRSKLEIRGNRLRSKVNGREFVFGKLETPTLAELRQRIDLSSYAAKISVEERVGNVQLIHQEPSNHGAIFQAASQFNLLEMTGPHVTPERGVDIYENDFTQGPACAIACGAATIYRNYFAEVNGQIGQSRENQIDCLDEVGKALQNPELHLWEMRNGYALPDADGLQHITRLLESMSPGAYDLLKSKLKVGIQWDTQVTLNGSENSVTQVYCAALPVSYTGIAPHHWQAFARLILEASYECMLYAALINYTQTGNPQVYLTLVGGGAFGNARIWIYYAMRVAIEKFRHTPLQLKIVSYGNSNQSLRDFIAGFE